MKPPRSGLRAVLPEGAATRHPGLPPRSSTLASVGLFFTMAVAVYCLAVVSGDPFVGHAGGYEVALLYLVISVLLLTVGPGRFSVDAWMRKKLAGA